MPRNLDAVAALTSTDADLATETNLYESASALAVFDTAAKTKILAAVALHKKRADALKQVQTSLNALLALNYPDDVIITLTDAEHDSLTAKVGTLTAQTATIVNSGL